MSGAYRWSDSRAFKIVVSVFAVAAVCAAGYVIAHPAPRSPHAGQVLGYVPPPPDLHDAAILGDSYTQGVGEAAPRRGFAYQVAQHFRWDAEIDGEGGTGYLNPGPADQNGATLLDRINRYVRAAFKPTSVIVVADGLNDTGAWVGLRKATVADFRAAVTKTLNAIRAKFPRGRLIVFGIWDVGVNQLARTMDDTIRSVAKSMNLPFFSPIREGWTPAGTGDVRSRFISADGVHPNQAGHDHIAALMIRDISTALTASP